MAHSAPTPPRTIPVSAEVIEELDAALEYLRDRVIGIIPTVLLEIADALAVKPPEPDLRLARPRDAAPRGVAEARPDSTLLIQQLRDLLAAPLTIDDSRRAQHAVYRVEQAAETRTLYREWLEEQAQSFTVAKDNWFAARHVTLAAADNA